ncbi:response regulator [Arenibacter sp. M-2]|uniref:response regulator n=1 Tax=unclassified Arenibacter TaxID=2615047 RepID=UPI000D774B8A|nr:MULTISPECIES: response regulator [unclassified Arenibacter]MDL5511296.1 response regulator [Arenibacter sp. M-2]PXX30724.1 signal transduction histidine kinase [Arenibacter sp. ARW7G5Y1]
MSLKIPKKEIIYPFSVFVLLMIVVVALWKSSLDSNRELLKKEIETNGHIQSQGFLSSGQKSIIVLENLMERLEMTNGDYFEYWEEDARLILKEDQSFKFVEWIDSSLVIRRIVPYKGNEAVVGMNLFNHPRREEWLRHVRDSTTNLTSWIPLIQGGHSILIDVPVFFGGKFQGTITAGMDFTDTFDTLSAGMDNYAIEIKDDKGTTFYKLNDPTPSDFGDDLVYVRSYEVDEDDKQVWTFYLMPRNKNVLAERNKSSSSILIFGVLISLLMSLLTYFYQSSRNENKRFRDLNIKLRVANRSLREERTKAEKASKAKTEFVSNMSHEIRTPLNAIMGFIEVLKESKLDSSLQEYLSLMDVSSKKLLLLVNDILEIDKIESGQISFKKDIFSPSDELRNIISIYRPSIETKGLYVNLYVVSDSKTHVIADIGKFGQILTNLLRNALKFTDAGGIDITYDEDIIQSDLNISIAIKDTGIGIPKSKLKTIFDRFTQIDSGITKRHEGSGLGLYITYLLIELLEGHIEVESSENIGTEFKISIKFPITEMKPDVKAPISNGIDLTGFKVLIVDDNKVNVVVLKKTLDAFGIKTYWVGNGKEAVKAVAENQYDLVFMDIHMPEMDGYEATVEIRKTQKDLIIIGFSADVTKETIQGAKEVGMNDYFTKPITFDKLRQNLSKYLVRT